MLSGWEAPQFLYYQQAYCSFTGEDSEQATPGLKPPTDGWIDWWNIDIFLVLVKEQSRDESDRQKDPEWSEIGRKTQQMIDQLELDRFRFVTHTLSLYLAPFISPSLSHR